MYTTFLYGSGLTRNLTLKGCIYYVDTAFFTLGGRVKQLYAQIETHYLEGEMMFGLDTKGGKVMSFKSSLNMLIKVVFYSGE